MILDGPFDERAYVREAIRTFILGGFFEEIEELYDGEGEGDEIILDHVERIFEDSGIDGDLSEYIRFGAQLLEERRAAEGTWSTRTTNDDLDSAFAELGTRGIVALQNAGYTQSEGWEDANQIADERAARGAVFYHGQDLERGVRGEGLMLTFGAYVDDEAQHDARSIEIAREAVTVLERHGVATEWNGTVATRIHVKPFEWRRRAFSTAPRRY